MKLLSVLAFNDLGVDFWSTRTGFYNQIEVMPFSFDKLEEKTTLGVKSILVDFYFNRISEEEEISITKKILEGSYPNSNLFILSPRFAGSEIAIHTDSSSNIILHNFSVDFLKTLYRKTSGDTGQIRSLAS